MRIFKHRCQNDYFVFTFATILKTMTYKRFAMREVNRRPSRTRKTGIPELLCISGFAVPEYADG